MTPKTESEPDATRGLLHDPNLWVVFSVTLMVVLGVSSVAPVLPRAARAFHVSPEQIGLVITSYTLPGVFLTPVLGVLADRWGRKRVLVPGLLLFATAGAACSMARSLDELLILRVVQGIGAAPLGALNLALVGDLYEGRRRAAALGYNQTALSMGTAVYPALGGALGALAWYVPFALPLLALPVAAAVLWTLELRSPSEDSVALGQYLRELLGAVRDRRVVGLFGVTLVTFVLLYGALITYLPILMDRRFGASSALIGAVAASQSVSSGLAASQLGRLSARFRKTTLIAIAFGCFVLSGLLFPVLPNVWSLLVPALVFGVGMGLNLPTAITLITDLTPGEQRGAVLALNGTVLRVGQTLAPVIMGVAYGWGGLRAVYFGVAALALTVAIAVLVGFRRTSL